VRLREGERMKRKLRMEPDTTRGAEREERVIERGRLE
jgi:hypothetical protein